MIDGLSLEFAKLYTVPPPLEIRVLERYSNFATFATTVSSKFEFSTPISVHSDHYLDKLLEYSEAIYYLSIEDFATLLPAIEWGLLQLFAVSNNSSRPADRICQLVSGFLWRASAALENPKQRELFCVAVSKQELRLLGKIAHWLRCNVRGSAQWLKEADRLIGLVKQNLLDAP